MITTNVGRHTPAHTAPTPDEATPPGRDDAGGRSIPWVTVGIVGAAAAAIAGAVLVHRPVASKVIGTVEGVELLSNPRLPFGSGAPRWGTPPATGAMFGPPPGARVSIEHVDQGALGDCWNIAGMGAIAHRRPEVFEQMVRPAGDHVVVRLPERTVAVTRELPLNSRGGPAYGGSGAKDPVFWPAYVEKAQAAIARNGYRSLEGGFAQESFRQLLGTTPQKVASRGTILDDILHHVREERPVAVATRHSSAVRASTKRRMDELGIAANHYYVPTKVMGDGADAKVTLFNPWGLDHPRKSIGLDDLRLMFDGLDTPDEFVRYGSR